ncbi:hypothetical protein EC957_004043 [Mortierella hygrophila]|uniref:Uncharacterized protein n=1 Tax=Mortierella hygrophila TaxID=979708 RepID=A0A9P6F200_9FUNG|nr:hypothetical protein EC957_004043 [Mortierella hygrophila]
MTPFNTLLLLAVLATSAQHSNKNNILTLVQASPYQDAAHYALPPNIYDNIPPGLTTPTSFRTYPTPAPAPAPEALIEQRDTASSPPPPAGTESGPTGFDITAPLVNNIYTPGSGLIMTWSNREVVLPDSWVPPQAILDLITHEANFSNSPLLTKADMRNLAMMKMQDLRAAQQANAIKDSPVLLKNLRLLSWPLSDNTNETTTRTTGLSAKILSDPGFNLLNNVNKSSSARLTILGTSGGALLWTIPADWAYEGEFEIEISTAAGTPGRHTSNSFWILRDAVTRQLNQQYNLPSMDQQQQSYLDAKAAERTKADIQRQRDMGVFSGVAAMMSAVVLVGLGVVVGMYRRKWAAQEATAAAAANRGSDSLPSSRRGSSSNLESAACCTDPSDDGIKRTLSSTTTARNQYAEYTSSSRSGILSVKQQQQQSLLDPLQGDEDAHSPKDLNLNLSEETLRGVIIKGDNDEDEKTTVGKSDIAVVAGGEGSVSATPVDESFEDLPLYEYGINDSASTLANEKRS